MKDYSKIKVEEISEAQNVDLTTGLKNEEIVK